MNYLLYIEHSAENLQFFLWLRNYTARFNDAKTADMALAPPWTQQSQDQAFTKLQKEHRNDLKRDPIGVAGIFKGTDFEKRANTTCTMLDGSSPFSETNPFNTPPRTPLETERAPSSIAGTESTAVQYRGQANDAFTAAGIKAPCKWRQWYSTERSTSTR